jgi:hypothetical protein
MDVTRETVLDALGRVVTRGITLTALADDLGLRKHHHARLRAVLEGLKTEGSVATVPGGGWALAPTTRGRRRPGATANDASAATGAVNDAPPRAAKRAGKLPWKAPVEDQPGNKEPREAVDQAPGPGTAESVSGRITVHPAGYGFVVLEDGRDVFVPAKFRGTSLDGDRVVLSTWLGYKGTEGRVVEVVAGGGGGVGGQVVWGGGRM